MANSGSTSDLHKRLADLQKEISDLQKDTSNLQNDTVDDDSSSSTTHIKHKKKKHRSKSRKRKHTSNHKDQELPPVRAKKHSNENIPVRIDTSPVRLSNDEGTEEERDIFNEELEEFNARASQTEGYESFGDEIEKSTDAQAAEVCKAGSKQLDVEKLICVSTEEERCNPIDEKLAELIKLNWGSKKPLENMKKIFKEYPCPENCTLDPPQVNTELWKILNSTQKKSDVKLVGIQKSLKKALNVNLKILEELKSDSFSVQSVAQKTIDMAAILGHASHEISLKRRIFIRGNINPQYKDLCSQSQPITTKLFGDDLPKLVKELSLTNKIGSKFSKSQSFQRKNFDRTPQRGQNYTKRDSFLGRGRGSLPYRQNNSTYTQSRKPNKKSN